MLENQKNKLRKLEPKDHEKVFYATDIENRDMDDESCSLLQSEQVNYVPQNELTRKIVSYNTQTLNKFEREYAVINKIYDEMSTLINFQAEGFLGLSQNLGNANSDVVRGNEQLVRNYENENKGISNRVFLVFLGLLIFSFIFFAIFA